MSTWYWKNAQNAQPQGPVTANELRNLARTNQIGRNNLVWKNGMENWVPANKLKGLFDAPGPQASAEQRSTMDAKVHHSAGMYQKNVQQAAPWGATRARSFNDATSLRGTNDGLKGDNYEALPTFFSFRGRIRRTTFFLHSFGIWVGFIVFIVIIALLTGGFILEESLEASVFGFLISIGVAVILSFPFVKRLHDLNLSGWFYWISIIPLINILFGFYVLLGRGSVGPNEYGPDPR